MEPKSGAAVKIGAHDQIDSLCAYIHINCQIEAYCMEIQLYYNIFYAFSFFCTLMLME